MPKPTKSDADILLRIEELSNNPETREAFHWWREKISQSASQSGLSPDLLAEGSEGASHAGAITRFFETVGTLAKHRLVNEDLLYDRWLIYPFWETMRPQIEKERQEATPLIGENFEWVAVRNEKWAKARASRMGKTSRR